jgi:hypothetical protein
MADTKKLVEEAMSQIKSLENVIAENAKGILSSTMKNEISSLVKESLREQEEIDVEDEEEVVEPEGQVDDVEDVDLGAEPMATDDDMEDDDMEDIDMGTDDDDAIDMTGADMSDVIKVFKSMDDEDGVIVKRDASNNITLSDSETGADYFIQLSEQYQDELDEEDEYEDEYEDEDLTLDETLYEIEMDDFGMSDEDEDEELEFEDEEEEMDFEERPRRMSRRHHEEMYETPMYETNVDETLYEIEMDDFGMSDEDEELDEEDLDHVMESKFKAKGVGMGSPKFKYGQVMDYKTTKQKEGKKMINTGSAKKFSYKDGENLDGEYRPIKKRRETTEASRTLGAGTKFGRKGLPKPKAAPQHISETEVELLKSKNEEYRKALNLFRTKLNEVAIFNSNLAYATRLFTEHSTTKQEKINILRRFDNVETLKESKSLYKSLKDEFSSEKTKENSINESFEKSVTKTPVSGSAVNLIESKTYENPQFLRMKDLMGKIK